MSLITIVSEGYQKYFRPKNNKSIVHYGEKSRRGRLASAVHSETVFAELVASTEIVGSKT